MLNEVAKAHLGAGDLQEATAVASFVKTGKPRDDMLGRVVDRYREARRLSEALGIAERISRDKWRRNHLPDIARGQVDAGDRVGAKATANRIEDPRLRDKALNEIARRSR